MTAVDLMHNPHLPVGIAQIADVFGVQRQTVETWKGRKATGFPDPRWTVGGSPGWCLHCDVLPWAERTGRATVAGRVPCPYCRREPRRPLGHSGPHLLPKGRSG